MEHCKSLTYADDIVLYRGVDNLSPHDDVSKIHNNLNKIEDWCDMNELTIIVKKTKA